MSIPAIDERFGSERLIREGNGWITRIEAQPEMTLRATEALERSAESRSGNLRLAVDGHQVFLLGELREAFDSLSLSELSQRLLGTMEVPMDEVLETEVACVLDETGYDWSQLQQNSNQWQAVVGDRTGQPCTLKATIVRGGVEVRSPLADWEAGLGETAREAVARFLAVAHGCVRFARFDLQDREASVVSFASADRLDVELPDSVASVRAVSALVRREVRALVDETVAQNYLAAAP